jgi:hypothetical protein
LKICAQTRQESPKYRVVSIKPNNDSDFHFAFRIQPGSTFLGADVTLKLLVKDAYDVPGFRVVGQAKLATFRQKTGT